MEEEQGCRLVHPTLNTGSTSRGLLGSRAPDPSPHPSHPLRHSTLHPTSLLRALVGWALAQALMRYVASNHMEGAGGVQVPPGLAEVRGGSRGWVGMHGSAGVVGWAVGACTDGHRRVGPGARGGGLTNLGQKGMWAHNRSIGLFPLAKRPTAHKQQRRVCVEGLITQMPCALSSPD